MVLDHLAAFPRLSSVHAFVPVHWHIWLLSAVHTLNPSGGYHWIFTVEVSLGISAFDVRRVQVFQIVAAGVYITIPNDGTYTTASTRQLPRRAGLAPQVSDRRPACAVTGSEHFVRFGLSDFVVGFEDAEGLVSGGDHRVFARTFCSC